jgi:hypothetical protein
MSTTQIILTPAEVHARRLAADTTALVDALRRAAALGDELEVERLQPQVESHKARLTAWCLKHDVCCAV